MGIYVPITSTVASTIEVHCQYGEQVPLDPVLKIILLLLSVCALLVRDQTCYKPFNYADGLAHAIEFTSLLWDQHWLLLYLYPAIKSFNPEHVSEVGFL